MKHDADMVWLLCMQQQQTMVQTQLPMGAAQSPSHPGSCLQKLQQQQLNPQQSERARLHSLLLQLTSQQREQLSKMPSDKCIQLFQYVRILMALQQQQQHLQQQMCQQGSWQQPSGLQQTGAGPMQQPASSFPYQVCSRADVEFITCSAHSNQLVCFADALLYPAPSFSALQVLTLHLYTHRIC